MQVLQPLERRVAKRDGSIRYLMRMAPYRTATNKVDGALLTFVDVSSVVPVEEFGRVLVGELNQRVDEVLGLAIELASRTMREAPAPGAFAALYQRRGKAMTEACRLMERDLWSEQQLREVVGRALAAHLQDRQDGVSFGGPPLLLWSRGVLAIGLIVHDLARQSAESGALSLISGRVSIRWQIEETADGASVIWTWNESGTPERSVPFDAALVEICAEHQLDGRIEITAGGEGLRATLRAKLTALGARAGEGPH